MADAHLLERAARCYQDAGRPREAARCYRDAGAYRRSADLFVQLGELREASDDYARSGLVDQAAWILVHDCGDPVAALELLATVDADDHVPRWPGASAGGTAGGSPAELRRQVVTARCALADGAPQREVVEVLTQICEDLARPRQPHDVMLEIWCVQLAETMGRDDQVAQVFAAAVRGGRSGARKRWEQWCERMLGTQLVLPADEISAVR